ncbi:MAG: hypothetical protein R3A44_06740 [Caldilineaceae bacterium]
MPTKTERILSYLPGTFRALPKPTALYSVSDAFGAELLKGENSLAAVMQAHWVDRADQGAELIQDLASIAALYGLAPREGETVEEFREHLKRYIRTFLEGTVTVQGALRITAESLGLHIADDYDELDAWWTRGQPDDELVTVELPGHDAAPKLLGTDSLITHGVAETSAQVRGAIDLSNGVDLSQANVLRLKVDGKGPFEVDLTEGLDDPTRVAAQHIVDAVNAKLTAAFPGKTIATLENNFLRLAAPTRGPEGELEVQDDEDDAAEIVLGLPPRAYNGKAATAARVTGTVDLSGALDLTNARYLRLLVDGTTLAEIDCAGPDPANMRLSQVVDAINRGLGFDPAAELDFYPAAHDGKYITLTSPSAGLTSTLTFQRAAAQDAFAFLFGDVPVFHVGRADEPARITGRRNLSSGVDLSEFALLQLQVDGAVSLIDCAGEDPANTQLPEIVNAINQSVGALIAADNGRFLTLHSPTNGPAGELLLQTPPERDATALLLSIGPRRFEGRLAGHARVVGETDLSKGVDVRAQNLLQLAIDDAPPITIDLRKAAPKNAHAVSADQVVDAINNALERALTPDIAATDGERLILTSPSAGSASSLRILPVEAVQRRRFVTRAIITDEATAKVFGAYQVEAHGSDATNARLVGQPNLSRGVDLSSNRFLRLALNGADFVEIDCAGTRPRATLIQEVVDKINAQFAISPRLASHNGKQLILSSNTLGTQSRIEISPPRSRDALPVLMGIEPAIFRGQDATRVIFTGTVDLRNGVDLSAADRIKITLDGADALEIACAAAAADPSKVKLNELMLAINLAVGSNVASHDGKFLILASAKSGAASQLRFATPDDAATDATAAIFGIAAPRTYQGTDEQPGRAAGVQELGDTVDLSSARFLRIGVDGKAPIDVDCAASTDPKKLDAVPLSDIENAIDTQLNANVAAFVDGKLVLTSPTAGKASRIVLEAHTSGDATPLLLGNAPAVTTGQDATPAVITGADLLTPVDLRQRSLIRVGVDGARPVDIDIAGFAPQSTFLHEIVPHINAALPGLATTTADDRLQLTSPTVGAHSRLSVLPLRYLELLEYPPAALDIPMQNVRHGDRWPVNNDGAAAVNAEFALAAPLGVSGPTLVNMTLGWQIRVLIALSPHETLRIWRDASRGLRAAVTRANGEVYPVPGAQILVGPVGSQAWVPFTGDWRLSRNAVGEKALQLNNPRARAIVQLRGRDVVQASGELNVRVTPAALSTASKLPVSLPGAPLQLNGRVQESENGFQLRNGKDVVLVNLRGAAGIDLTQWVHQVVWASGTPHADLEPPLLVVDQIEARFDVTLRHVPDEGATQTEKYENVTIGDDPTQPHALVRRLETQPSKLVRVASWDKATVLTLPQGRSDWRYLDCYGSRFNQAHFDEARFAGGLCLDRGIFNVSRFTARTVEQVPPEPIAAVFTSLHAQPDPPTQITMQAVRHQPGAFTVNLPVDLPEHFGGRFNEARFGQGADKPELYAAAVTEPRSDDNYIEDLVNENSPLLEADVVTRVPLGWTPVQMPFRQPQLLTLGSRTAEARIYLAEPGLRTKDGDAGFLELKARQPGQWGNGIAVAARQTGPAMYDFTIAYPGARFENARAIALGKPLSDLVEETLEPGPVGVLQAKAAGVFVEVSRE